MTDFFRFLNSIFLELLPCLVIAFSRKIVEFEVFPLSYLPLVRYSTNFNYGYLNFIYLNKPLKEHSGVKLDMRLRLPIRAGIFIKFRKVSLRKADH